MYNVNRKKIEEILNNLKQVLEIVRPILNYSQEQFIEDKFATLALERAMHISVESIVDVGNYLIDGFIMRDPGSYVDIIEILNDERVIPDEEAIKLKQLVEFRKNLVHDYTRLNYNYLFQLFKEMYNAISNFEKYVYEYLRKELG
ncbi:hypothetical protein BHF71_01870 [Vulcanibacillus modesticaldus]|uniref:DUF86 domain-containing protein n=1 Tax=Vulcanibacillus modesticaldus TaxID=337097 RepID=A0A1D2YUH0_9BACI|nr:DUF86 domain-containing protein [Vulcanibacillus modesticaldus]OEF99360.1 hypothetical protein BHF71_01870 [Vulcanibacillus modesticaldus]